MKRIYDYKCLFCNEMFAEEKEMSETGQDIKCPKCNAEMPGPAARYILPYEIRHIGGRQKGSYNSRST